MSDSSLGRKIQERAKILLEALLNYDPDMDSDRFKGILKGSLGKNPRSQRGYDQSQKLTFDVYSLSNQAGRRVEATVYSLAKLSGMVSERELTEEEVKDAIRCLKQFEIIEQSVVKGKTERTLTLKYKDKGEILARFEQKCQDWNAQNEAKSSKDPWTRVRHFVPPEFDLLDQTFFQKRRGGESRILKLPSAAKNWSLITQGSYIERDQQGDVLELAEELAEYSGISLLLIRGEPGAGKTALMQWLAYELSSQERIVLQTKKEDLYWLEPLWEFSEQVEEQHFYLIADDLFRDASILDELDRNELQFPLTLIGTTRLNKDQQDKLRMRGYWIESLDLELSPSSESQEKERILERIRQQDPEAKARLDLKTPAELEKLMAAPSMLVLMLQLSEGKHFDLIVADVIKRLPSEEDYPTYQVFGVICSFYQYGIITPPEVVPLCLPEYSQRAVRDVVEFAKEAELKGLVNTIFKFGYEGLITIHSLIAQTAMTVKYPRSSNDNLPYSFNSLEDHLRAAIQALNGSKEIHKRWIYYGLMLLALNGQDNLVRQILKDYPNHIQSLQQGCGVTGWFIWSTMYQALGLFVERGRCLNAILSTEPQSLSEWTYWLSLIERCGTNQQKQEAINRTATWLQEHPEDYHVHAKYLGLIEQYGTPEQKGKTISHTANWLEKHLEDSHVRTKYLAMIEQCRTPKRKREVIAQTAIWLQNHPENVPVRNKYLRLIEKSGTPEQKQEAIAKTAIWLQNHPENVLVRNKYLKLIEKCGSPEQKRETIAQTTTWLQDHPENVPVRNKYLKLIEKCDSLEQKQEGIALTTTWLRHHPENINIVFRIFGDFRDYLDYETCYWFANLIVQERLTLLVAQGRYFIYAANFFRDYGDLDTAEGIYLRIIKYAEFQGIKHSKNMQKTIDFASLSYARLLVLRKPPDPYRAIDYLQIILNGNSKHGMAHLYMAQCYQAQGRKFYPQAIESFHKAIEFDNQKNGHFWYEFGCFYRDAIQNPTEARKCFENSLNQKIHLPVSIDLAELEVEDGNFERARESLQQGLALVPITRPEKEQWEKLQTRIQQLQAQLGLWEVG